MFWWTERWVVAAAALGGVAHIVLQVLCQRHERRRQRSLDVEDAASGVEP